MKTENKIRGLVLSDLHWGGPPPDDLYDELNKYFIKHLVSNKNKIDVLIFDGDYWNSKLSLNERSAKLGLKFMEEVVKICKTNNIVIRMIKGTLGHEFSQLDVFNIYSQTNFTYSKPFNFRIISKLEEEELFPGFSVLWVPEEYIEDYDEYYDRYTSQLSEDTKYDMIFGHGTFDSIAWAGVDITSERVNKKAPVFKFKDWNNYSWGPIIFGHIHTRQSYKQKLYYPGSFTRWCYGELPEKGFIDFEYDLYELKSKISFIENKSAKKYITINLQDICENDVDIENKINIIKQLQEENGNVKIKLSSSMDASEVALLRESFSSLDSVKIDVSDRLQDEKEENEDDTYDFIINREFDVPTTIQKYIKIETGKEIPIDLIKDEILEESDE